MAQSSRFTKTTPRFPLADLRIPAAQPLSIQRSGPGGGEPTDVWRPEPETKLPRSPAAQRSGPGASSSGASVPSPVPEHNTRNESDRSLARPHGLMVCAQEKHTWSGPRTKWLAFWLQRSPLPPASESCASPTRSGRRSPTTPPIPAGVSAPPPPTPREFRTRRPPRTRS